MDDIKTVIGTVVSVSGNTVSVQLSDTVKSNSPIIDGIVYRIGQIGSFVKIPLGYCNLYGIVTQIGASAIPDSLKDVLIEKYDAISNQQWLSMTLIGEQTGSRFERGVSQSPTTGDSVHLVTITDLQNIYGGYNQLEKVLIPVYIYYTERKGDLSGETSSSWYKPCDTLYNALNLKYGNHDTALFDSEGKLICFDSQELLNEKIGFYIEKETFLKFLEDNDYACFWTILSEKRIIGGNLTSQNDFNNIIKSGVIYMDQNKNLVENINTFINE